MDESMTAFRERVATACASVGPVPFTVDIPIDPAAWDQHDSRHRARWFGDVAAAICQAVCGCAATASTDDTTRVVRIIGYDPTT